MLYWAKEIESLVTEKKKKLIQKDCYHFFFSQFCGMTEKKKHNDSFIFIFYIKILYSILYLY